MGDSLRASVLCDDAEAFWKCWQALLGDPKDPNQKLRVTRLKNKLGKGQEPFNSWPTLTFCADESRGARRCQLNGSIGALERGLRLSWKEARTYCPPSRANRHRARDEQ